MKRRIFFQALGLAITACFGQSAVFAAPRVTAGPALRVTPAHRSNARTIGKQLVRSRELNFSSLNNLVARSSPSNIMTSLFIVFRESVQAMEEDKKYFLQKLELYNEIAKSLADYLKELNDASGKSGGKNKSCSPTKAIATTLKLEKAVNHTEYKIRKLPIKQRSSRNIRALRRSLKRDRQLIIKARTIYRRQQAKIGSACS